MGSRDALALIAFVAAAVSYHRHVHTVGKVAAGMVLVVFVGASGYCGLLAWRSDEKGRDVWISVASSTSLWRFGSVR